MINLMEGLNQLFATQVPNQRYAEYMSSYVVLRTQGQSHAAAIVGLRSLLQAIGVN